MSTQAVLLVSTSKSHVWDELRDSSSWDSVASRQMWTRRKSQKHTVLYIASARTWCSTSRCEIHRLVCCNPSRRSYWLNKHSVSRPGRDSSGVWCTQLTLKWNRHQKNVTQEEVCWWKHHRMSSQPSRNYKRKKKNHRNIFPACFHSLHYLAGFPSCPEAYLHVWSFLSLGFAVMLSAAMCFTGARPHSHILGIPDLFGFWKWGLTSSPQESLWTLLWAGRAPAFHPLGWAQIYCYMTFF